MKKTIVEYRLQVSQNITAYEEHKMHLILHMVGNAARLQYLGCYWLKKSYFWGFF